MSNPPKPVPAPPPPSGRAMPKQFSTGARRTLVMFSSGIDSTYTLVKLLKETSDEIHAHHIHLINIQGRHEIEALRSRQIVDWCKTNIRPFRYTESAIDHRGFTFFGFDIMSVGFEAGIVARSYGIHRWTIGTCQEEGHQKDRFRHVEACCAANCFPEAPPEFFLLEMIPKAHEIEHMGPHLRKLCWTCRNPFKTTKGYQECGTCKTCRLLAGLAQSQTESQNSPEA